MADLPLPDPAPEALARAEAALAALSAEYLHWVRADVDALAIALAALRGAGPGEWSGAIERVHALAHNIKGQGATFGYPLLTELGQALCALLKGEPAASEAVLARMDALLAAMAEIVAERLAGDGGARGRDLLHSLDVEMPVLALGGLSPSA